MSERRRGARDERGPGGPAHRLRATAASVAWLALVWVLLWGTFSPLTIVGGILVGAAVTAVIRLPPAPDRLPLRPLKLLGLAAYLAYDLVVSGAEVSWQTVRYGGRARGVIVAVPLLTASDRVATVIANALSLSPGTMVLQVEHAAGLWYVYALGPRERGGAAAARRQAMDMQRRVLAALGSPAELADARRWLAGGAVS